MDEIHDPAAVVRLSQTLDAEEWLDIDGTQEPGWLLPDITRLTGRLYPGTVSIVSGRPGAGKTTLLGEQVAQWAREGYRVRVFPLETEQRLWRAQWAARACDLPWDQVLERDWAHLPRDAKARLRDHFTWQRQSEEGQRVEFIDPERLSVADLLFWIRDAGTHGTDLVVVDHVQELDYAASPGNKTQAMDEAARSITATTREAGVRTVLVSQLTRPQERDPIAEFQPAPLGSLIGTSAWEQVATTVLMLHRGLKTDLVEGDLVSVRRGQKPVTEVVEPGCMVVNVLKNRQKGNVGAQVRAYVHQGKLYPDRDRWQQAAFHTQQAVDTHLLEEHLGH